MEKRKQQGACCSTIESRRSTLAYRVRLRATFSYSAITASSIILRVLAFMAEAIVSHTKTIVNDNFGVSR
jgi:hypothetical protein